MCSSPHDARFSGSVRVAVFGGGIAGLTVAHELVRLGFRVDVYECNRDVGGFFRSAREPGTGMPTEYSWHGMGPWYHNTFDLLRQIPFDDRGSVFARGLTRPIDFGIFPDRARAEFFDRGLRSIPRMFRWSGWEFARWAWTMLKAWSAGKRSEIDYSAVPATAAWRDALRSTGWRTWRACFGPWIGSDWKKVSWHTAGRFFCRQLTSAPAHPHPADAEGPAWSHGARAGWLLLRGPSSEFWFDRWVKDLIARGVGLHLGQALAELRFDGERITEAVLASGERIEADSYVLAVSPFAAAEVLERTPRLREREPLAWFRPLTADGPHTQISFRLAFAEPVRFPRARTAVVVADSEFNLTLFAEEQAWDPAVFLGEGIRSLWTGTCCVSSEPGRLFRLPAERCTKEQFVAEVLAQIRGCGALDELIREANGGRGLADFAPVRVEVWPEWEFSPAGIRCRQPKWVTTTHTQPFHPPQATPVPNLFLAGAHTRTAADVWSIEGAVESGRRAAQAIDPRVRVLPQHTPRWLTLVIRMDDWCYRWRLPHVLDLALGAALLILAFMAWRA